MLKHAQNLILSTYTVSISGDGRADEVADGEGLGDAVLVTDLAKDRSVGITLHANHQVRLHAVVSVSCIVRLDTRLHKIGISIVEVLTLPSKDHNKDKG